MGCQSERQRIVTSNSVADQLMRIRLISQQQQMRQNRQLKQQQQLLLQIFANDAPRRSGMTEKAMIGRAVFTKNMLFIHKYIEVQAKSLLQKRSLFEGQNNQILLPSINIIVYCSLFLNEEALKTFYSLIKKLYPTYRIPNDAQIRYQLIRYHRYTNQVTFEMENTFVLQFCSKYSIEMVKVNEVGHNYGYGCGHIQYQA